MTDPFLLFLCEQQLEPCSRRADMWVQGMAMAMASQSSQLPLHHLLMLGK